MAELERTIEQDARNVFQKTRDHYLSMTETHNPKHTFLLRWVGMPIVTLTGLGLILAGLVQMIRKSGMSAVTGTSNQGSSTGLVVLGLLFKVPMTCGMCAHKVHKWAQPDAFHNGHGAGQRLPESALPL